MYVGLKTKNLGPVRDEGDDIECFSSTVISNGSALATRGPYVWGFPRITWWGTVPLIFNIALLWRGLVLVAWVQMLKYSVAGIVGSLLFECPNSSSVYDQIPPTYIRAPHISPRETVSYQNLLRLLGLDLASTEA